LSATRPNSRSAQLHSDAWPTCTVRARPTATRGHGPRPRGARPVFTALARPMCVARAWPTATRGAAQLDLDRRSTRHGVSMHDGAWRRSVRRWRDALLRWRPHQRTGDGREGVAGLTGAWTAAAQLGVDGGVGTRRATARTGHWRLRTARSRQRI
jgi:hypothetical protein